MTDERPIHETGSGVNRMKCVKNGVKILYGVDSLQSADRYRDPETGDTVLLGFGEMIRPSAITHQDRVEKAVERADVIPERVKDRLDEIGVDYW